MLGPGSPWRYHLHRYRRPEERSDALYESRPLPGLVVDRDGNIVGWATSLDVEQAFERRVTSQTEHRKTKQGRTGRSAEGDVHGHYPDVGEDHPWRLDDQAWRHALAHVSNLRPGSDREHPTIETAAVGQKDDAGRAFRPYRRSASPTGKGSYLRYDSLRRPGALGLRPT